MNELEDHVEIKTDNTASDTARVGMSAHIPKVTVIVPVYNPGLGIGRCIESLRNQTLSDIELIFVDDCGTDGAMDNVRAAAVEDSRIRIISNPENLGPGPSRNAGIEAARGEWLSFVDADDYVSPDFLALLYNRAHKDGLDIAKGTAVYELNGQPRQRLFQRNDAILSGLAARRPLYRLFTAEHWTGLYRRALLMESGARYGTARNSQDDVFLLRVCHAARTFGMESRATYHYVFRNLSAVNTFNAQRLNNQLASLEEQVDYLVAHFAHDENAVGYALGKLGWLLGLYTHTAGIPELQAEVANFLAGLRQQALRLPYLEEMKTTSFAIRALVDYGVGLSVEPYSGLWKELDNAHARFDLVKRWCDFALAHPELGGEYGKDLQKVLQNAQRRLTKIERNTTSGYLLDFLKGAKNRLLRLGKKTARKYLSAYWLRRTWRLLPRPYIGPVRQPDYDQFPASVIPDLALHESSETVLGPECVHTPKVSVIVPVWNPGPGFARCLESLRGQTLADIELIFVDDCGTDGAMGAVRAAVSEDPRIRVITNLENLGPGLSRNAGIEAARGEWLAFVDADDYAAPDFLELLFAKASAEDLDIVKGSVVYEQEDGTVLNSNSKVNEVILSGLAEGKPLYSLFHNGHYSGLFRQALVMESGARNGTSRIMEDSLFLLRICRAAQRLGVESRAAYHYVRRAGSTWNTFNASRLREHLRGLTEHVDILVACRKDDKDAGNYAIRKIMLNLNVQAHAANLPELQADAAVFLSGILEQALRLPFIESMKSESLVIRALVDHGTNLSMVPALSQWSKPSLGNWSVVVRRWIDFALAHPELEDEYVGDLRRVLQHAADAVAREMRFGPRLDVKIFGTEDSELELRGVFGKGVWITTPDWLYRRRSPGTGYVVEPHPGQPAVTLDFICKTGGEFTAMLRGAYVTDRNGKLVPKWVTCTGLTCNGDVVFEGRKRVWYGQPYHYTRPVRAGETVQLTLRWQPESFVPEGTWLPKGLAQDSPSPKVSVVVPVWNPGPGFERCLESLRAQTLADIELIFVDDCGTDGAMNKVRVAAAEDGRIRIITNSENLGPGLSRNRGIEAARGEYLSFVDADDYVSSDFLELLYNKAWTDGLDIAKGAIVYERDEASRPFRKKSGRNGVIRSGLAGHNQLYRLFRWEHQSGLYRRAVLMESGARYGVGRNSEDITFLLRICHAARNLGIEDRAVYHYVFRETSAVNTFSAQRLKNQLDGLREQTDYLVAHVTHDNDAVEYALDRLGYLLEIHAYAACNPELGDAADAFLAGLREQALRLPFFEDMKAASFAIRALVDHGVNLRLGVYSNVWGTVDRTRARIALAGRWAGLALAHPLCACEYAGEALASLCKRVKRRLTRPGNNAAHRYLLKFARGVKRRLPRLKSRVFRSALQNNK